MTNLPATLSTLQKEISELTERLKPATQDHVSDAVSMLLSAGLTLPAAMDPQKAPAVYAYALAHVSSAGLKRAVAKLIRGEYENINRAFIPAPPELAAMARRETKTIADDLARTKLKLESMTPPPVERKSPDAIKRVRAMLANFVASNDVSARCADPDEAAA